MVKIIPVRFSARGMYGDFDWMIRQPAYQDTLFIYNDNEETFYSKSSQSGAGNAIIRPFRFTTPPRALPIPTGLRWGGGGYPSLNSHNKIVIDTAINDIKYILIKYGYDKIMYSADEHGKLGTSIFVVGEDVKTYIVSQLLALSSQV